MKNVFNPNLGGLLRGSFRGGEGGGEGLNYPYSVH